MRITKTIRRTLALTASLTALALLSVIGAAPTPASTTYTSCDHKPSLNGATVTYLGVHHISCHDAGEHTKLLFGNKLHGFTCHRSTVGNRGTHFGCTSHHNEHHKFAVTWFVA